jgi:hypothetical protein
VQRRYSFVRLEGPFPRPLLGSPARSSCNPSHDMRRNSPYTAPFLLTVKPFPSAGRPWIPSAHHYRSRCLPIPPRRCTQPANYPWYPHPIEPGGAIITFRGIGQIDARMDDPVRDRDLRKISVPRKCPSPRLPPHSPRGGAQDFARNEQLEKNKKQK